MWVSSYPERFDERKLTLGYMRMRFSLGWLSTNWLGIPSILFFFIIANLSLIVIRIFSPSSLIVDQSVLVLVICLILSVGFGSFSKVSLSNLPFGVRRFAKTQIILSASFLFIVWVLLVPGTVERSRSLAIFQWITYDQGHHTQKELEAALIRTYDGFDLQGFRLRLHEHEVRGLVSDHNGIISLTDAGKFIQTSAKITAFLYRLNGWYDIPLAPNKKLT
jgi:signal transduction histidine kinase